MKINFKGPRGKATGCTIPSPQEVIGNLDRGAKKRYQNFATRAIILWVTFRG